MDSDNVVLVLVDKNIGNSQINLFHRTFEGVVNYCSYHGNVIPLSFVLGFYVTVVMNRWWNQYTTIPWPDSIAVFVSATIHGQVRMHIMYNILSKI